MPEEEADSSEEVRYHEGAPVGNKVHAERKIKMAKPIAYVVSMSPDMKIGETEIDKPAARKM